MVPGYARVWGFVRDVDRVAVEEHYAWLLKIAEGAALTTKTTRKVTLTTGLHEYVFNRPLQEAMQRNLETVGGPKFGEAEQQFARDLQRELGLAPARVGLSARRCGPRACPRSQPDGEGARTRTPSHHSNDRRTSRAMTRRWTSLVPS